MRLDESPVYHNWVEKSIPNFSGERLALVDAGQGGF